MNRPLVLALALSTFALAAAPAGAQLAPAKARCATSAKTLTCSEWSVAGDRLRVDHHGYASDGALVVRRGSSVRARLTVQNPATCGEPGLLLKDLFSGRAMQVPLLTKNDGLALALANRQALAGDKQAELVAASLDRTLGGALDGDLLDAEAAAKFAGLAQVFGTPYHATVLATLAAPKNEATTLDVGLWLPENMPVGAFSLTATCGGQPDSLPLPLAVLFNPFDATASEFLPDESVRKAGLFGGPDDAQAGPLDLPFKVAGQDALGGELALRVASGLPLSVRAVPALVGLAVEQAIKRAAHTKPSDRYFSRATRVILWQSRESQVWSDATGHFDLWDGAAMATGEASASLWGRWAAEEPRLVVSGRSDVSLMAAPAAKGLIPGFFFESRDKNTASATPAKGLPAFLQPLANKGSQFGSGALLRGTPNFVDDWQGETGYMAVSPNAVWTVESAVDSDGPAGQGFLASKFACDQDKACTAGFSGGSWSGSGSAVLSMLAGNPNRVRYGQCWVFSGLMNTTLRSIGIPTRPVTNFNSAHEKSMPAGVGPFNRGLVSAVKYRGEEVRAGGDEPGLAFWDFDRWASEVKARGGTPDSIWNFHVWTEAMWASKQATAVWNFHVWNEAWVQPKPGDPHTWHAYDATPQELSDPVYEGGIWSLAKTALGFSAPTILLDAIGGKWLTP